MRSPMKSPTFRTALRLVLVPILLAILILLVHYALPASVGTSDFIGYWAGARLLWQGQNPYDGDNILEVQRLAYPDYEYPMYTWNPPWLGALLLPLGALGFRAATTTWLLVNLLLIAASSMAIWWLFDGPRSRSRLWLALPVAFLFAQTITVLDTGQITTFMLVGVTGFLVAYKLERWMLAGAFLAFTTIKPHLVFLWFPLVVLWTVEHRRWRIWLGFFAVLALWLVVLTAFLPSWVSAYSTILDAPPVEWATPTLGGFLLLISGTSWSRFVGILLLPGIILVWHKTRGHRPEVLTAALLPLSLALAAFGWSYDQILLLVPILAIVVALIGKNLSSRDARITVMLLALLAVALFVQRVRSMNDAYYFWVPWATLLLGVWTSWRHRQQTCSVSKRVADRGLSSGQP